MTQKNSRMISSNSPINEIPTDMLQEIFSYFSFNELLRIVQVCKKWNEVVNQFNRGRQNAFNQILKHALLDFDIFIIDDKNFDENQVKILTEAIKNLKQILSSNEETYQQKNKIFNFLLALFIEWEKVSSDFTEFSIATQNNITNLETLNNTVKKNATLNNVLAFNFQTTMTIEALRNIIDKKLAQLNEIIKGEKRTENVPSLSEFLKIKNKFEKKIKEFEIVARTNQNFATKDQSNINRYKVSAGILLGGFVVILLSFIFSYIKIIPPDTAVLVFILGLLIMMIAFTFGTCTNLNTKGLYSNLRSVRANWDHYKIEKSDFENNKNVILDVPATENMPLLKPQQRRHLTRENSFEDIKVLIEDTNTININKSNNAVYVKGNSRGFFSNKNKNSPTANDPSWVSSCCIL